MVKPGHPRFRYVVFRIGGSGPFSEVQMLDALDVALPGISYRLVEFSGSYGIMRCSNIDKEDAISALNSIREISGRAATVQTIGTSGTIRKARLKFLC